MNYLRMKVAELETMINSWNLWAATDPIKKLKWFFLERIELRKVRWVEPYDEPEFYDFVRLVRAVYDMNTELQMNEEVKKSKAKEYLKEKLSNFIEDNL